MRATIEDLKRRETIILRGDTLSQPVQAQADPYFERIPGARGSTWWRSWRSVLTAGFPCLRSSVSSFGEFTWKPNGTRECRTYSRKADWEGFGDFKRPEDLSSGADSARSPLQSAPGRAESNRGLVSLSVIPTHQRRWAQSRGSQSLQVVTPVVVVGANYRIDEQLPGFGFFTLRFSFPPRPERGPASAWSATTGANDPASIEIRFESVSVIQCSGSATTMTPASRGPQG